MMRSTFVVGAAATAVMKLASAQAIEWLIFGLAALLIAALLLFFALLRSDRPFKYRRTHRNGGVSGFTIEIPRRRKRDS